MGIGERQIHRRGDSAPTRTIPVENQEVGGVAGYHVQHWKNDRQDAIVTPKPVQIKCEVGRDGVVTSAHQV